ncbi:MAG: hypothetical protein KA240_19425, partial [Nitrospira sp.]|nr:hypothetical protein [Nitrospira sp.]MBP6607857.1 hypothetical protein [Nitrospira sp.]MBP8202037.1 hypothetical protein [Nitrospira sp.]MBP9636151.1 hypothetical protein [Nitrospira sp.]
EPGDAGLEGGDESIRHPVCRAVQSECGVKLTRLTHRKSDRPSSVPVLFIERLVCHRSCALEHPGHAADVFLGDRLKEDFIPALDEAHFTSRLYAQLATKSCWND